MIYPSDKNLSQDEDLKKLSSRTEELLSRLNDLSNNLNTQLKPNNPKPPTTTNMVVNSSSASGQTLQPVEGTNLYSINVPPLNGKSHQSQYLEKREERIQTTENGLGFLTTKKTSIFTEQQHHIHSPGKKEGNIPTSSPVSDFNHISGLTNTQPNPNSRFELPVFEEYERDLKTENPYNTNQSPPLNQTNKYTENLYTTQTQTQTKAPAQEQQQYQPVNFNNYSKPEIPPVNKTTEEKNILKPAAVYNPRNYRSPETEEPEFDRHERAKQIAEKLNSKNQEIKKRLNKYSSRIHVSSQVDNLKLFGWLILGISPFIPAQLIKDDILLIFSCTSLSILLGIFFCMVALRLVEISELTRWAHNQILQIRVDLDEQRKEDDEY